MECFIGWEMTRLAEGCWLRAPHRPELEKLTLDDYDAILTHLRGIIATPYGNHLRKVIAQQLLAVFEELESEARSLGQQVCGSCGFVLEKGACRACAENMLLVIKPRQPSGPAQRPHIRDLDVAFCRKIHAIDMKFDKEYRREMSRYFSEEHFAQYPSRVGEEFPMLDGKSRFSRFGRWLRKKLICGV